MPSSWIRWLNGRYANVDGIPFKMPVRTQTSPAMFAAFAIDADQAAGLLPGQDFNRFGSSATVYSSSRWSTTWTRPSASTSSSASGSW